MASLNNLPHRLTSFVGREREKDEAIGLLARCRLLTLTGTGGSGKTRLALEVASCVAEDYPQGAWLVELSSITDPALPVQEVATLFGVREEPGTPLLDTLAAYLHSTRTLLVLDNCEHLVDECAELADRLLTACPGLRVLATSRQPLGLDYEVAHRVPPMSMPDATQLPQVEELERYEALRLFVERATAIRSDFVVGQEHVSALVELAAKLDGLPLAIELAAARTRVLSVQQIVERLDERFRLLSTTSRSASPRHRSLQAVMDWSYELLSEEERAVLRSLSMFAGAFTLEAVQAVSGLEVDEFETIDLLSRLVDRSLLNVDERGGAATYRMLETIRRYGIERLEEAGEATPARDRLLEYYTDLAESTENELLSVSQPLWLERLEREHDNLRASLEWGWTSERVRNRQLGLRLAGALVWFWYFRGYLSEGRTWLERLLGEEGARRPSVGLAKSLSAAGVLSYLQSDYLVARERLEEGLRVWRALGDLRGTAFALTFLGRVAQQLDDPRAAELGAESVALFREHGDKWGLALSLDFLGEVARERGDHARAEELHRESMSLYLEVGHSWGVALELSHFGHVALRAGDYATARQRLEEAIEIQRTVGDKWMLAWTLHNLGHVVRAQGDHAQAAVFHDESLQLFRELGGLGGMPAAAASRDALFEAPSLVPQPPSPAPQDNPHNLTPREIEVLQLIAEGLTDAQVADRLVLSTRTVQAHLRSIYSKLDITTRSAATRYALEHGLVGGR
ncbi:MAG TPA: tetratricopeptide repeat protein [Chloroflexia bacterium]|nr:tetratricopeptide repeat protein [Chloroflexia bacterium]